jgi:hypothetical protein
MHLYSLLTETTLVGITLKLLLFNRISQCESKIFYFKFAGNSNINFHNLEVDGQTDIIITLYRDLQGGRAVA